MSARHILLIVTGGIAAVKIPELIRLLRRQGTRVTCVLTQSGARFVTALSLQTLSESKVHTDLWSLTEEHEMGHIQLSRAADLIVVAPATAHILASMAAGLADDLATTILLATDKPVLAAPAMNVRMWQHPATQANLQTLTTRGVTFTGPDEGEMACHEWGPGRLAEPAAILAAINAQFAGPLTGRTAIVTSGPTHEPIDPVRYLANRSSGRQGHAIAEALAALGATVTLVHGPVSIPTPANVHSVPIQTATEMLTACQAALPTDILVAAAAVADWRPATEAPHKLKKHTAEPTLPLTPNPDILATLAAPGPHRPALVIGFAAETQSLLPRAEAKRRAKNCDWLLANDVGEGTTTLGGTHNQVTLLTPEGTEPWPPDTKQAIAHRLAHRIAAALPHA